MTSSSPVTLNGRTYVVQKRENGSHLVYQVVKKADGSAGMRSLRGHGRAYRPDLIRAVIDASEGH